MKRPSVLILVLVGLALGGLVLFLAMRFPDALNSRGEQIQLTHALLILGVVGAAFVLHGRFQMRQAARHAAIWIGLGAMIVLGYSFRDDVAEQHSQHPCGTVVHTCAPWLRGWRWEIKH